jgi:hypothetical protein
MENNNNNNEIDDDDDDEFNDDDEVCYFCDKIVWRNTALRLGTNDQHYYVHRKCFYNLKRDGELYRKYYKMKKIRCEKCLTEFMGVCHCGFRVKYCVCEIGKNKEHSFDPVYPTDLFTCSFSNHVIAPFPYRIGIKTRFPHVDKQLRVSYEVRLQEKNGTPIETKIMFPLKSKLWEKLETFWKK